MNKEVIVFEEKAVVAQPLSLNLTDFLPKNTKFTAKNPLLK